MTRNGYFS